MASMDHLPNELLPNIFKHLGLMDLPNCRLVSTKWKFFIDEVKVNELAVYVDDFSWWDNWYLTNAKFNPRNSITLAQIERCPFVLAEVERLRIKILPPHRFNPNKLLAKFPRLCQLEVYWIHEYITSTNWNLPSSVKTIFFDIVYVPIRLNAPQLRNVSCDFDITNIKFLHRESVKHLRIGLLANEPKLRVFPNVEHFHCGGLDDYFDLDLCQLFPNAKEMHFEIQDRRSYATLRRVINSVIEQKNIQGRTDLNIFYDHVAMVNRSSFRNHVYAERYRFKKSKRETLKRKL